MAYSVNLFNFTKRKNSTKRPTSGSGTPYDCKLKDGTSIANPIFIISGHNLINYYNVNYMEFANKYYYVTDVKSISYNVVEISGNMDVLATYRTEIRSYQADIGRCSDSSLYDTRQYDNLCVPTTEIQNKYHASVSSGLSETNTMSVMGFNSQDMEFYASRFSPQEIASQAMSSNNDILDMLEKNMGRGNEFFNMAKIYPFRSGGSNFDQYPDSPCYIGTYYTNCKGGKLIDINNFSGGATTASISRKQTIDCGAITCANITTSYTDFRRYDKRFTQIVLIVPFVGQVDVDPIYLNYTSLNPHYYVDLITGKAEFVLRAISGAYEKDIAIFSCQMGVDMPISVYNTNWLQIANDIYNNNPVMAIAESQLNPPTDKYTLATTSGFATRSIASIYIDAKTLKSIDKDYDTESGIPTNKKAYISNVANGAYIECLNPSVPINGRDGEAEKVNSYLKGGFYNE